MQGSDGLAMMIYHSPTHAKALECLGMDIRTAQALVRFGLGRRGAEPLPSDPAAWLLDQLRQPDPTRSGRSADHGGGPDGAA